MSSYKKSFYFSLFAPPRLLKTGFVLALACLGLSAFSQTWQGQGPAPNTLGQVENIVPNNEVVGAIHVVVAHPSDPDILWAGAANGGIWRTDNATNQSPTWVRQTDSFRSLSIGAIALDPTDLSNQTLVAGIGLFSSFGGAGGSRIGILRTTDGGTTWNLLAASGLNAPNISGIAARGQEIVVSVNMADSFTYNNIGIFRSTDGGANFSQVSNGTGTATGLPAGRAYDLVADPQNGSRLFTAIEFASDIGGIDGIYRSDDFGITWAKVSDATIDALIANGTVNVELAVGNNNNVYAAVCNNSGQLGGLFRSGDGGGSWASLDLPSPTIHPGQQASIHLSIVADPNNHNIVYIGGDRQNTPFPNNIGAIDFTGNLWRCDASANQGSQCVHLTHSSFSGPAGGGTASSSSPHADSRDMAFDANGNLIETDDGGIYRRTSPQDNTGDWFSIIGTMASTEFHNIAYDSNANVVMGGAQDTGSSAQEDSGAQQWISVSTADGGDVAVDDTTTPGMSNRFSSFQNLGAFRKQTFDSSNTLVAQSFPALTVVSGSSLQPAFVTPVELHGVDKSRLIILGGNGVFESEDQGDTLVQVSDTVFLFSSLGADPVAYGSNDNADILYVATSSEVHVRVGAIGSGLTQSMAYPGVNFVRDIVLDLNNGSRAFVVDSGNVFITQDAGASWANISGNLGSLDAGEFNCLAFHSGSEQSTLFVGTDRGVFQASSTSSYTSWSQFGTGLPNAPVFDLDFDPSDRILAAGTLGRGAWTITLPADCPQDLNNDNVVDINDLFLVAADWLSTTNDLNDDDTNNMLDMVTMVNNFTSCL